MPLHPHGRSGLHVVLPSVWECLRSGCSVKKSQQSKEAVGLFLRTRAGSPNCLTCCLGSPGCCRFLVAACAGTELRLQDLQRGSFSLSDISAGSWLSVDLCCSICLEHKSSESRTDPVLKWQNPLSYFMMELLSGCEWCQLEWCTGYSSPLHLLQIRGWWVAVLLSKYLLVNFGDNSNAWNKTMQLVVFAVLWVET